jgi:hypothetical protein
MLNPLSTRFLLPLTLAVLAASATSQAALLAYDPFNQAPGAMDGTRSSGGGAIWPTADRNWFGGNANALISEGSLSYGPLLTEGNQANLDTRNGPIFRAFDVTYGGNGSSLWISFLIVATDENTASRCSKAKAANRTLWALAAAPLKLLGCRTRTSIRVLQGVHRRISMRFTST